MTFILTGSTILRGDRIYSGRGVAGGWRLLRSRRERRQAGEVMWMDGWLGWDGGGGGGGGGLSGGGK